MERQAEPGTPSEGACAPADPKRFPEEAPSVLQAKGLKWRLQSRRCRLGDSARPLDAETDAGSLNPTSASEGRTRRGEATV